MPRVLSDEEITALLKEPKVLPMDWVVRLMPKAKMESRFLQRELSLEGEQYHQFRIVIRKAMLNPMDFSAILVFVDADGSEYRLLRCNGRHPSQHTNRWEKRAGIKECTFKDTCHIHFATERYQHSGFDIDGFAEPTTAFDSLETGIAHLCRLAACVFPKDSQVPDNLWENN